MSGYTLTELLMVVSIMGLIGAVSGVWLKDQLPQWALQGATRQIRSDLVKARVLAARQGNKVRIRFLDAYRYAILDDQNNNGKADGEEWIEIKDLRDHFQGVSVQSTNHPIFHPRGTASNLATVVLSNSSGEKTIKISITGRVTVHSS